MAMPPNDMMFEVKPAMRMGMNAIRMATGMVTTGMAALGKCHRKIRMISATTISSSISVCLILPIDARISSERSYAVTIVTPSGRPGSSSLILAFTRSMTRSAFSPWRMTTIPETTSPWPFRSATPRRMSGPNVTLPISRTRIGTPDGSIPT